MQPIRLKLQQRGDSSQDFLSSNGEFSTDIPGWAIALIVMCAIIILLNLVGILLIACRKMNSSKTKVMEV